MIDKKLGTGHAGGLTRSMVFALWPHRVTVEDCGSTAEKPSPANCKVKGGVCAKCYGALPDGNLPPIGFPAGLIAAQSIGERGTQLSMKSVQMATKAIDIDDAKKAIRNAGKSFTNEEKFRTFLKSASAYEKLQDRHFAMLWKVISEVPMSDPKDRTLRRAIELQDSLNLLGYNHAPEQFIEIVMTGRKASRSEPVARLLVGKPASHPKPTP
jgi:hypothetical protein